MRVRGFSRALAPGAIACLVAGITSCSAAPSASEGPTSSPPPDATSGEVTILGPGELGVGGGAPTCPAAPSPVFAAQVFSSAAPGHREFYSWTSDDQAAAIRASSELFTEVERPGLGPGYAFLELSSIAAGDSDVAPLAAALTTTFQKGRYAWLEPWATRMGWPGEDYGGNLLRIVLKPEAWVVVVKGGAVSVVDLNNAPVSLSDAMLHPERLGAIFYWKDASAGGPLCGGSFTGGSNGYREFIVGNLAMVEEWSLGTTLIRDRISANVEQLQRFLSAVRACPVTADPSSWNLSVVCGWDGTDATSEIAAYQQALALPSANYVPDPAQLAALITTLQADLFEPDPLVVTPGSP